MVRWWIGMVDRKKVIKGLLCIKGDYIPCATCKYANADGYGRGDRCKRQCASDALALLEEQKPKKVIGIADSIEGIEVGNCPSCDRAIVNKKIDETKFCKFCGQAVKWE